MEISEAITDERLKRSAARSERLVNRRSRIVGSPTSTPGAIRMIQVSGMNSMNSTGGDQVDSLEMAEEDSSSDRQP
jgi:hypothetical protein